MIGCPCKITVSRSGRIIDVRLLQTSAALLQASEKASMMLDQLQKDVIYMYICVSGYVYTQIYVYKYIYVCVCACVCVCIYIYIHMVGTPLLGCALS
jgi:hypothetical protein